MLELCLRLHHVGAHHTNSPSRTLTDSRSALCVADYDYFSISHLNSGQRYLYKAVFQLPSLYESILLLSVVIFTPLYN